MKKKKIALFCTGWIYELLYSYCKGAMEGLKGADADLYVFLSYALLSDTPDEIRAGTNIYNLPDLKNFDGAMLLGNSLDFEGIFDCLVDRCKKAGIPCVSTGRMHSDTYYVGADNYPGQYSLVEHLIRDHGISRPLFIAGNRDNPDSMMRLAAFKDACKAYDVWVSDDNIFYSNWEPDRAEDKIAELCEESGDFFYDAVICANDSLAISSITTLKKYGLRIPEDIIVTGFDNDNTARIFDPTVSSVDQQYDVLGMEAAKTLIDIVDGRNREKKQEFPCMFVKGESCGCVDSGKMVAMRRRMCADFISEKRANTLFDRFMADMDRQIQSADAISQISDKLEELFSDRQNFFGNSFHFILDPSFEKGIVNVLETPRTVGYSDVMKVSFSAEGKNIIRNGQIDIEEIVPQNNIDENRFFMMVPVFDDGYTLGYAVFGDNIERIKDCNYMWNFTNRLAMSLSKLKQNLTLTHLNARLTEISETDALTHVKSRNAYEAKEKEMNIGLKDVYSKFALAMFDINNLKVVNDKLGHELGDIYLKNNCYALCRVFKHSPVYRMGGDEFLAILTDEDYDNRETLYNELQERIKECSGEDIPVVEAISIATGIAVYDSNLDKNVSDVLRRADELMYENKALMKGRENIR